MFPNNLQRTQENFFNNFKKLKLKNQHPKDYEMHQVRTRAKLLKRLKHKGHNLD